MGIGRRRWLRCTCEHHGYEFGNSHLSVSMKKLREHKVVGKARKQASGKPTCSPYAFYTSLPIRAL